MMRYLPAERNSRFSPILRERREFVPLHLRPSPSPNLRSHTHLLALRVSCKCVTGNVVEPFLLYHTCEHGERYWPEQIGHISDNSHATAWLLFTSRREKQTRDRGGLYSGITRLWKGGKMIAFGNHHDARVRDREPVTVQVKIPPDLFAFRDHHILVENGTPYACMCEMRQPIHNHRLFDTTMTVHEHVRCQYRINDRCSIDDTAFRNDRLVAIPCWPSSLVNFAGGSMDAPLRIGHAGLYRLRDGIDARRSMLAA